MSTLRDTISKIFDENTACVLPLALSMVYGRDKKYANSSEEVIRKHKECVNLNYTRSK